MNIKMLSDKDFKLIKRAAVYIKPYKIKFLIAFVCIISGIVFGILQPLIWGGLLTSLFEKDLNQVLTNIIYILIIYLMQTILGFLQAYLFSYLSNNIVYDLKRDMYKKILELPVKAFDSIGTGEFISRLQRDAESISNIITNQLLSSIVDVLKVIILGVAVLTISIPLSIIIIAVFPIAYLIFKKSGKIMRIKSLELARLNDNYINRLQQSLTGIREIICLGIKNKDFEYYKEMIEKIKKKNIKYTIVSSIAEKLSMGVTFMSQIIIIALGGYLIFKNTLSLKHFIAFSSYAQQFSNSLINITQLNPRLQEALTSLERIFKLMDNLDYKLDNSGSLYSANPIGKVKFKNISFKYDDKANILNGISFEAVKNGKTAIVGMSGSGKTTIFNLLLRFYKPEKGIIEIDDIDLNLYKEKFIRENISIVRQEPFLFNTSIRENFLLANPSASNSDIISASKEVYMHDYIDKLPQKYDSIVGENGINLSGGQKQRIAIARVLLRKSKIVLFDEATSSIDNESQYFIKKSIDELAKNHTVIIIAHKLYTIIESDKIIVIDNGEISAIGKHDELINNNSTYKLLYEKEIDVINNLERGVI